MRMRGVVQFGAGVLAMGMATATADTTKRRTVDLSCGITARIAARYDASDNLRVLTIATPAPKAYRGAGLITVMRDHATAVADATERHYVRVRGNTKSGKGRLLHGAALAALEARVAKLKIRAAELETEQPKPSPGDELLPGTGISKASLEVTVCTHRAWCYVDDDPRGRACSHIRNERVIHPGDIPDVCRHRYGFTALVGAGIDERERKAQCPLDIRAVTHDACKIRLAADTPNVQNPPSAAPLAKSLTQLSTACAGPTHRPLWITSGCRSAQHQATLMFDGFSRRKPGKENVYSRRAPANRKKKRYHLAAELVKVYRTSAAAQKNGGIDRATVIKRMTGIIRRQMKRGDYVSEHLRASAVDIRTFCYSPGEADALAACIRKQPNVSLVDERRKIWKPHFHLNFRLPKQIRCRPHGGS